MSPNDSDKFKNEYHKFADDQVHNREDDEGTGRLRLALFIAALGPGAAILFHTIKFEPPTMLRWGMLASAPLSIVVLILNFARLPARMKGAKSSITILIMTLVAAAAAYPAARYFSLLP